MSKLNRTKNAHYINQPLFDFQSGQMGGTSQIGANDFERRRNR
jgi:hypothetical protein